MEETTFSRRMAKMAVEWAQSHWREQCFGLVGFALDLNFALAEQLGRTADPSDSVLLEQSLDALC